jgi:hypothetical protein
MKSTYAHKSLAPHLSTIKLLRTQIVNYQCSTDIQHTRFLSAGSEFSKLLLLLFVIMSTVIQGNESCFRTSENVSNIIGVLVIKVCMKSYTDRLRRYYCFLLQLDIAMQQLMPTGQFRTGCTSSNNGNNAC